MREHSTFNADSYEQQAANNPFLTNRLPDSTQLFQPSRPMPAPVDDGMTMMMDPISQDDLRTAVPNGPFPAAIVPLQPVRGGLAAPKRVALVGATLLAAALLVYIGRGYIHQPVVAEAPPELAAPAAADDTIAEIPLTVAEEPGQPSDAASLPVTVTQPVVVLAPVEVGAAPVSSDSAPAVEQAVAELDSDSTNLTDVSVAAAPVETTEPVAAESQSDAAIEPVADLPAPAAVADLPAPAAVADLPTPAAVADAGGPTSDEVAAVPTTTTADQVTDQTGSNPTVDQAETTTPAVADETTSVEPAVTTTTTEPSTSPVAEVVQPQQASQQRDRRGADNQGSGDGLKVAGQVLNKLSQPINTAGPVSRYFGQR